MKWINLPLLFLSIFLLVACGSDPEPVEEQPADTQVTEDTKENETPEPEEPEMENPETALPEEPQAEDLSDLIAQAEAALVKASEVRAADYYPDAFAEASDNLDKAIAMPESDWEKAKALLQSVVESGQTLYDDSLKKLAMQYRENLIKLDNKLQLQEAPYFVPSAYQKTEEMRSNLEGLLESGDLTAAYDGYRRTYRAMDNLSEALANDIAWIKILIRDTETYMADAEEAEAYIYAEEELNMANDYYLDGLRLFDDYNLADAEHELLYAKYYARKAALAGGYNRKVSQTDSLMREVMGAIEEASKLTVVDEDGNIVNPEPWDSKKALEENPLSELKADVDDEEIPNSNLQSDTVPIDGTDGVKGETEEEGYLDTAKELWSRGVQARNSGDLELAEQYFLQAKIFVEAYESNAVTQVYTVQWREVDTDCLWRIAGYDSIYDNPFLWPKIWRRNKKIIQNPDLIFPGQVLVIPPK